MKKILTLSLLIIVTIAFLVILNNKYFASEIPIQKDVSVEKNNGTAISIYLQASEGSTTYNKSSSNSFPSSGYTLNTTKTYCLNGSTVSFSSGIITISFATADECYIYFDVA